MPGARPTPGTTTGGQLARFEGARLKLRKAANGRYALGVEFELALDKARPGQPGAGRPGGMKPGRRPQLAEDDLEAFAVPDDLPDDDTTGFGNDGETDAAFASGADEAYAAEDSGEDEAYATGEGEDDTYAAESEGAGQGDDDTAYAAGQGDEAYAAAGDGEGEAGDAGFAAEPSDDQEADTGDAAFAPDAEDVSGGFAGEAESAETAQWPNQLPVPKGVFAISQAPAIFDAQDTEEEDEGDGEALSPQAAARPARRVGTAKGMLAAAKQTIGMAEHPPGSNHNKITEWYNTHIARIGNGPWCDMAVTYWAGHSNNLAAILAGRNIGYAYTVAHAQKFQQRGRWHAGIAGIKPGDVVFFDWRGTRSIRNIDHVGVVERVSGKRIVTIEGNTTGNSCRRMVRDAKYIVGYGRPVYGNK